MKRKESNDLTSSPSAALKRLNEQCRCDAATDPILRLCMKAAEKRTRLNVTRREQYREENTVR